MKLSRKTQFVAQNRAKKLSEELFSSGTSLEYGANVSFVDNLQDTFVVDNSSPIFCVRYSRDWIKDNKEYPTLLNNFIYLFEYVDSHMLCILVSKQSYLGVFERAIKRQSYGSYLVGTVFHHLNLIAVTQMKGYYEELSRFGIRLEAIIEWFFLK